MSWALALGPETTRPARIIAISGFLPRVPGFSLDRTRLAGLPVGVAHGTADPVIPVAFGDEASDVAEAAGAQLTRLRSPVPHMVDPAWIGPLAEVVTAAVPPGGWS